MKRIIPALIFSALTVFMAAKAPAGQAPDGAELNLKESVPALSISRAKGCVKAPDYEAIDELFFTKGNICAPAEPSGTYAPYASLEDFDAAACLKDEAAAGAASRVFAVTSFYDIEEDCAPSADEGAGEDASFDEAALDDADSLPDVPIVVNKNVESFIKYFQTRGRKYFERWWDRSSEYMVMLRGILRENGLPEDLSYIAFIESGLNPTARSRANAVGMWQFIRGTALKYGLRVDWWIDERMDPEKATYAASRYFKNLYDQFGSWYLAAAGYNAGEGKIMRAVKKHNTDDFWMLASKRRPLRRETKEYVPKYLAALLIAKDPESYGFEPIEYYDTVRYEKVKVSEATDLRVIAEATGSTVEEIKRINPELLRWFTPPNYPDYVIKVPAGTSQRYYEYMSTLPPTKKIAFRMHKVRRGDTISKIAKLYGTSITPILYINNLEGPKKTRLKPGSVIAVPLRADDVAKSRTKSKEVAVVLTHWELQG